jgi:hypothetical protein
MLLLTWALLLGLSVALALVQRWRPHGEAIAETGTGAKLARRFPQLWLLPALSAVLYFEMPVSYGWIWPINARFALLTPMVLLPLLPVPRAAVLRIVCLGFALLSAISSVSLAHAFREFDQEVGELDDALAAIPVGERVAALVFDRGSRVMKFSPFLHAAAWYQAERGGAVMFTFADFPQSPFRFREENRPPVVPPRWEWRPAAVDPARDLLWYSFVLVRGEPGLIAQQVETFEKVYGDQHWTVWRRRTSPSPP